MLVSSIFHSSPVFLLRNILGVLLGVLTEDSGLRGCLELGLWMKEVLGEPFFSIISMAKTFSQI